MPPHSVALRTTKITLTSKNGFALVATILLMILLVIISVAALSLSAVSLRTSSQDNAQSIAQANARMALMLAISQLQKSAGPDQRITTTADQMIYPGSDGSESSAAPDQRHWSGVYRSWLDTDVDRPDPEFLTWLVSGPSDTVTSRNSVTTSAPDPVVLVDNGTLGDDAEGGRVVVPSIKLGESDARLAWWTSGQGVKATIDTPHANAGALASHVRADLQAARQMSVQLAANAAGQRPFSALGATYARRRLVTDWPQAAFVSADGTSQRGLFHDLAAHSSGMLTNVRNGGFRSDLSMYLERSPQEAPREVLYRVNGKRGIDLAELWLHYNIYKELRTGSQTFTTGGESNALSLRISPNLAALKLDHTNFYKYPNIISYKSVLSFHSRRVGTPQNPKERLYLVVDPIITFWNPLDVPVHINPAYFSIKFWQLPFDVTFRIGTRNPEIKQFSKLVGPLNMHYLTLIAGKLEPIVLKPGEVLVYSQASNSATATYSATLNYIDGKAGWNLGGGMAYALSGTSQIPDADPTDTLSYETRPNNDISKSPAHWHLTSFSLYYKEDRDSRGESLFLGNNAIDDGFSNPYSYPNSPKPDHLRVRASAVPHVFNKITPADTRPLSFAQLSGRKEPFMLYAHNSKTENGSDRGGRWLARKNPKIPAIDFATLSSAEFDLLPYEIQIEPLDSWRNRNLEVSPNGTGFYGGGLNAEFGTNYVITHAVPREPIHSLAAFQHAFANGSPAYSDTTGHNLVNNLYAMLPFISHPIGNSLAPSVISAEQTSGTLDGGRVLADHSYLVNQALWDNWYLSSISPDIRAPRPQRQVASDFLKNTAPLPIARYRSAVSSSEGEDLLELWFSGAEPTSTAHLLTAAALRVDGLFNVNSTSVEAWKAVLGALRAQPVITLNSGGVESITPGEPNITPVANLIVSDNLIALGEGNVDTKETAQWTGRRTLSDEQIDALAKALVREVRKRGPFLSLADFVNRRPAYDSKLAISGAIQSALDSPEVGINTAYVQGARAVPAQVANRFPFPEAEAGAAAYGVPGIIKQADILTPIAPILSVRSDSFLIRAYGECVVKGKVVSRAWCEAVVERQPEFISPADSPNNSAVELQDEVNRRFGRRFEIISFRWLSPKEI